VTINASNEGKDVLGELLKQPGETQRAYDPRQWQDAENGQARNRVLMHGSGNDAVELVEAQPPISRFIDLPAKDAEAVPVLNKFFEDNPDLLPHQQEIANEAGNLRSGLSDDAANRFGTTNIFNLAVARVCQAHAIPVEREAPRPAPLEHDAFKTLHEEIARLQAESKKVHTDPGPDWGSVRRAVLETSPVQRKRK
jgi:hypothetical protein